MEGRVERLLHVQWIRSVPHDPRLSWTAVQTPGLWIPQQGGNGPLDSSWAEKREGARNGGTVRGGKKRLKLGETVLGSEEGVRRKKIARARKGCCLRMCSSGKSPQMLVILRKKKRILGRFQESGSALCLWLQDTSLKLVFLTNIY